MLFPSLTIHSVVKYSALAIKKYKVRNLFVQRWGASILGEPLPSDLQDSEIRSAHAVRVEKQQHGA